MIDMTMVTPPHDFDVEQSLLGTILLDNRAHLAVADITTPEHFADPLHGRIFDTATKLLDRGQAVSAANLRAYFAKDLEELGAGVGYLASLLAASISTDHARGLGEHLRDLYLRRMLFARLKAATEDVLRHDVSTDAVRQIEDLDRDLTELAGLGRRDGDARWFAEYADEALAQAEAAYSRGTSIAGVPTGLGSLDRLLGGMRPSDLIILAGRPSMGKSALATNIACGAAATFGEDRSAAIYSLEMSGAQLAMRVIAERADVPAMNIPRGELISSDMDRFMSAATTYRPRLLIDETPGLTITALRTRATRIKRQHGLSLLVVDYLQLLEGASQRRDGRAQEVSDITRGLKNLAKELDVPVLALSQLSRAVEQRDDKRPQLADLRESGSIEQDADIVAFVFREEYYLGREEPKRRAEESDEKFNARHEAWAKRLEQAKGRAEVIVAKHRHGAIGSVTLNFDGRFTKFSDVVQDDGGSELPL